VAASEGVALSAERSVVARLRAAGCVFAEDEARLLLTAASTPADLDSMVDRRVAGLPLEHILGWAEFCGLRVEVDPGVFVPRRRTELLVREATALLRPGAAVVDLCCGSGAVGAALLAATGRLNLYAVDIEPAAVRCAERNLAGTGAHVYQGDLFQPLPATLRGGVDVVAANVPYVPTGAIGLMPPEARDHEPRVALDGGDDGLAVLRRVAAGAPEWLAPGGHLLIEASEDQVPAGRDALARAGMRIRVSRSADIGATVLIATTPV
jgi:release factor glutamine methyltransferase